MRTDNGTYGIRRECALYHINLAEERLITMGTFVGYKRFAMFHGYRSSQMAIAWEFFVRGG